MFQIENDLEILGLPADEAYRHSNSHFNDIDNFDERIEAPTDDADAEETYTDDYQDEKSLDVHFLVEVDIKIVVCDFKYRSFRNNIH